MTDLVVLPDEASLASEMARRVRDLAADAVSSAGLFTIAVSGGSTPARFLAALSELSLPWDSVHVFQVDERVAPDGDPSRNLTQLRENLLDRVPLPGSNVHPMPVERSDLASACRDYEQQIRRICGPGGVLDAAHLGLGDDGHTASWPPGDPVSRVTNADVAVVGPYRGRTRMTLTPAAVNRSRNILWLVSGSAKKEALAGLLDGDRRLPACAVRREAATVLADEAAASRPSRLRE